jgi:hypothetical protein
MAYGFAFSPELCDQFLEILSFAERVQVRVFLHVRIVLVVVPDRLPQRGHYLVGVGLDQLLALSVGQLFVVLCERQAAGQEAGGVMGIVFLLRSQLVNNIVRRSPLGIIRITIHSISRSVAQAAMLRGSVATHKRLFL